MEYVFFKEDDVKIYDFIKYVLWVYMFVMKEYKCEICDCVCKSICKILKIFVVLMKEMENV